MESAIPINLPDSYTYERTGDILKIKEVNDQEKAEEWIKKLSDTSLVTWRVYKTFPGAIKAGKLYCFKKQYRCFHNTRSAKPVQKNKQNTNCPVLAMLRIERHNSDSIWPCTVVFTGKHNHSIGVPSSLVFRPVSAEVKKTITELFEKGHTPSTAYTTYCDNMMSSLGNSYFDNSYDRAFFPTKTDVRNQWSQEFREKFGPRTGEHMLDTLREYVQQLEATGYKAKVSKIGSNYVVACCTPLMIRAHSLKEAQEIVFVDATGNCDVQNHRLYFIATRCGAAGGIPLACIITDSLKHEAFREGMQILVQEFKLFQHPPAIIMTDDDFGEREVLKNCFPQAKLLLCTFHVLKAFWKWLLLKKNQVPKDCRQNLYFRFKKLVYAKTYEEFALLEGDLRHAAEDHPSLMNYMAKVMSKQQYWAHCFRNNLITRGQDTNNVVEVMFRLFKDIPLERTKAFNLVQLVDYVMTAFERYYIQRLQDSIYGRNSICASLVKVPYDIPLDNISQIGTSCYRVIGASDIYDIDMNIGICSCHIGASGRFCKHQSAVVRKYPSVQAVNTLSKKTKHQLYYISSGQQAEANHFDSLTAANNVQVIDEGTTSTIQITENKQSESEPLQETASDNGTGVTDDANVVKCIQHIDDFSNILKKELLADPANMVPAIEKFMSNFSKCKTSSKFVSGLHTAFSSTTVMPSVLKSRKRGQKINVQPTSLSRRIKFSGCSTRSTPGRKRPLQLKHHNYTIWGNMPNKKRKVHSLSLSVESNSSLAS